MLWSRKVSIYLSSDIRIDPHNDTNIDPPPKGKRWPFGLIDRAMDSSDAINDPMLRSTIEVVLCFVRRFIDVLMGTLIFYKLGNRLLPYLTL